MNVLKRKLSYLSEKELIDLIDKYDTYIIEFCKDYAGYKLYDDVVPACLMDFYDYDYEYIE